MSRKTEPVAIEMPCDHVAEVKVDTVQRPAAGCVDCLEIGGEWAHLRVCLTCGHVGCCDSSPNQHATKHFHKTKHPIIASAEAGETWVWCFVHEQAISP
ncbi:MAG TPA: UBP-type zinc finger domain-containing protein [Haliangiales bacterium]|nr:UBP-type zinc finger domain-containing protein [Haliangiales bacterium]